MPYIEGYLIEGGPGQDLPRPPGHPSQGLPGAQPGVDNSLPGVPRPVDPSYGIPLPPVTIYPTPPSVGYPLPVPPTYPVRPDQGLPQPPTIWPRPPAPPTVWPPQTPPPLSPTHPIYPGGEGPNQDLPLPPGAVWPPLPPEIAGPVMVICWVVGVGYRWTVLDPSLQPSQPLPPTPGHPDQSLPPVAEPRR